MKKNWNDNLASSKTHVGSLIEKTTKHKNCLSGFCEKVFNFWHFLIFLARFRLRFCFHVDLLGKDKLPQ